MHFGKIAGISKPISRLMLGGTALDTAHLYGGGEAEQADGQWITR